MKTVLIVDDEPITRMDLRDMLTDLSFDVIGEAADGFDAIDRLQHHTGSAVPAPLDSLRGRAVRFDTVIEKDRMESAAVDFCRSFDL